MILQAMATAWETAWTPYDGVGTVAGLRHLQASLEAALWTAPGPPDRSGERHAFRATVK